MRGRLPSSHPSCDEKPSGVLDVDQRVTMRQRPAIATWSGRPIIETSKDGKFSL